MLNPHHDLKLQKELVEILNSIDPVGVFPHLGGPIDEYDHEVCPISDFLGNGPNKQELENFLQKYLIDHFGLHLNNKYEAATIKKATSEIFTWYSKYPNPEIFKHKSMK